MTRGLRWIVPAAALALVSAGAFAQGPPGGGGFQMTPEQQAQMKKWQKFRENNKHLDQLSRTLRGLGQLEQDPKTAITKDQAKKLLPIYKAWKNKPTMTDEQAAGVNKQVNAILNIAQIKKLNAAGPMGGFGGGRPGGGGPGGGGRPGGGGPGGGRPGGPGGMANFKMPDPAPYNPFNPASSPFAKANPQMAQRMGQRYNEFVAKLEAKAK